MTAGEPKRVRSAATLAPASSRGARGGSHGRVPGQSDALDPYKNFKFRLKWDRAYVAGVSHVSGLRRTTEVIEFREGGDASASRKSPGPHWDEAVTLERGLTQDRAFEQWAGTLTARRGGRERSRARQLPEGRYLDFYNEAGQLVLAYKIYRCWPSVYEALPDLDANSGAVAIERLVLENEGWERDPSATEPKEPSATA